MSYFDSYYDTPARRKAPRGTFKASPLFLAFVGILLVGCVLAWLDKGNRGFNIFLIVVGGWLVSLCFHEFAHALVAYHAGDYGVVGRGYLQLNPAKYTHWLMSIVLPLLFIIAGGIALPGGAVMIDHGQINKKWKDSAISIAGPAVNLIVTIACVLPFALGVDPSAHPVFWSGIAYLAFLQSMATLFNLLPIPGLDGGNAIYPWLPYSWRRHFDSVRPFGFLIVFLILWHTGVGTSMVRGLQDLVVSAGIPNNAIFYGDQFFRFWQNPPQGFPAGINF